MNSFSAAELAGLRAAQFAAMMDVCQVLAYSAGALDEYGMPSPSWVAGASIACGFDPSAAREVMEEAEVTVTDATVRLPINTVLDSRDRLKITHRFGEALTSQPVYEVIGVPERGPSGLLLNLRLVTDGSS